MNDFYIIVLLILSETLGIVESVRPSGLLHSVIIALKHVVTILFEDYIEEDDISDVGNTNNKSSSKIVVVSSEE